jgi:hypothetical protein
MASSRASRRGLAIARNQRPTRRELFLNELHNCFPRAHLRGETEWQARGRSIALSIESDRWLAEHGYDRWGQPFRTASVAARRHDDRYIKR